MDEKSLAIIVAKLDVQHEYTREALADIKKSIIENHAESDEFRVKLQDIEGELRVVRKIGAVFLGIATPVISGLLVFAGKIIFGF